jgi:hypothetical protein
VPKENLLACLAGSDLSNPQAIGDQTLWHITQSAGGRIAGQAVVMLSISSQPSTLPFTGIVTQGGQIRIEFGHGAGQPPTTGIGQMRLVNGAWYMQMQMGTGSSLILTHWAYMAQMSANTTPPSASDPSSGSMLSNNWRWLEGTHWTLTDGRLFPGATHSGVFEIDSFRNGYFWGSGTSAQPFNVLGSITPQGNVLLLVSVGGAAPQARTGFLSGGVIPLRSYEGMPAIGSAVLLTPGGETSVRALIASHSNG